MGLSTITYVLSRQYTDETASQFGGLKGAPCKIKSIVKENGQNIITFEWKNDEGETRESKLYVKDGTPIYPWEGGKQYDYGDLVIYNSSFYSCIVPNSDNTFISSKWNAISGGSSGDGKYDIIETKTLLPQGLSSADRKMYFCIDEEIFYLWNGTEWVSIQPQSISNEDIDALF